MFAENFHVVGHFYAPITYYSGKLLKYQGGITEGNRAHLLEKHPGGVIVDTYKGDRIWAVDHTEYAINQPSNPVNEHV